MKEVHVQIRLPYEGFPSQEQMDLRDQVEEFIEAKALGDVVDAGSGLGTMDLRIEAPAPKKAVAAIRAYLAELGVADHATCEMVRPQRTRPPSSHISRGTLWLFGCRTHHSWNGPHLSWYQAHDFADASSCLQKVGTIALAPSDPKTANSFSPWSFLAGQVVAQASWEAEHP